MSLVCYAMFSCGIQGHGRTVGNVSAMKIKAIFLERFHVRPLLFREQMSRAGNKRRFQLHVFVPRRVVSQGEMEERTKVAYCLTGLMWAKGGKNRLVMGRFHDEYTRTRMCVMLAERNCASENDDCMVHAGTMREGFYP